jgi:hypothetical protein
VDGSITFEISTMRVAGRPDLGMLADYPLVLRKIDAERPIRSHVRMLPLHARRELG